MDGNLHEIFESLGWTARLESGVGGRRGFLAKGPNGEICSAGWRPKSGRDDDTVRKDAESDILKGRACWGGIDMRTPKGGFSGLSEVALKMALECGGTDTGSGEEA